MTFPTSTPNWFDNSEAGAPVLNNAAGSLLDVLRACLIDGFNPQSVTSIVVASGVATVTTTGTHGFSSAFGKLILVSGAGPSLLNGRKRIGNVTTNTFTYPAPGVSDGTYTGTIEARRAPLGWSEPHTGTNVAMFARTAPEATAMLLRVDDTANPSAAFARVVMVESAIDVNTFSGACPTAAQLSGGGFLNKGAGNANPKTWVVCGNDRFIWIATEHPSGNFQGYNTMLYCFGDVATFGQPHPYACIIGIGTDAVTNPAAMNICRGQGMSQQDGLGASTLMVARYSDLTTQAMPVRPLSLWVDAQPFGSSNFTTAPLSSIRGAIHSEIYMLESATGARRHIFGRMPGFATPLFWTNDIKDQYPTASVMPVGERHYLPIYFRTPSTGGVLISLEHGDWHA